MTKNRIQVSVALSLILSLAISLLPAPAHAFRETIPVDATASEMRDLIESYNTDRGSLSRTYPDSLSPTRRVRFKQFYEQWLGRLTKVDFPALAEDGRIDY